MLVAEEARLSIPFVVEAAAHYMTEVELEVERDLVVVVAATAGFLDEARQRHGV